MATIVKHTTTRDTFILLGTGFGTFKASRPSVFFGDWLPSEEEGVNSMAAVCNAKGRILWINSEELEVIQVDGVEPGKVLT